MTPLLRIAVDCRPIISSRVSGVAVYTQSIINELQKNEDIELILFYFHGTKAEHLHELYPGIIWIQQSSTKFHLRSLLGQPKLKLPFESDLFWMPDRRPFFKTDTPVVVTIHDMVPTRCKSSLSLKGRLWHRAFSTKRILKNVDGVICPSFSVEQEMPRTIARSVTYEGAEIKGKGKAIRGLKDFNLMIAPMDPRKGYREMIKLAAEFPKDQFVWAGVKLNEDRFKKEKLDFPKNLKCIGTFSDDEKVWLLRQARLVFALSDYEGFDLPVLEAVRAKTPVIMSDIAVHRELYKEATFVNHYSELRTAYLKSKTGGVNVPEPRGDYTWEGAARRTLLFFKRVIENKDR